MNLIIIGTDDEPAWVSKYDDHPAGLIGYSEANRRCCRLGHPDPDAAIGHAVLLETTRIRDLVAQLPAGSAGRLALDKADART